MKEEKTNVQLEVALDTLNFKFNLLCSWIHQKFENDPTFPTCLLPEKLEVGNQVPAKLEPPEIPEDETIEYADVSLSQLPGETEIICNNNWLVNEDHHDGECDGTDSASQERKPVESDSITVNPPADRAEYDPGNDQLQVSFKEGISKKKKRKLDEKVYPNPGFCYSRLIAMSLINSNSESQCVTDIYLFLSNLFPYFQTTAKEWKSPLRRSLCTNFDGVSRGYWSFKSSEQRNRLGREILFYYEKNSELVRKAVANPESLYPIFQNIEEDVSFGSEEGDSLSREEVWRSSANRLQERLGRPCPATITNDSILGENLRTIPQKKTY